MAVVRVDLNPSTKVCISSVVLQLYFPSHQVVFFLSVAAVPYRVVQEDVGFSGGFH